MKTITATFDVQGQVGLCGSRKVFFGFALAKDLYKASFADVLSEASGLGYQRPRNISHSLDFKTYIQRKGSSTIPLTFNLRADRRGHWRIEEVGGGQAILHLSQSKPAMAQVDCQHRLGELHDSAISLAFMTYIGLSLDEEKGLFVVINSKAKGLSTSLTDFHEANLAKDLKSDVPHLYIAKKLNEDPGSPWYQKIRIGGEDTSGLMRRTSLRMMQKTTQKFLAQTRHVNFGDVDGAYEAIANYWRAAAEVFPEAWANHRQNLLTKGVGLYSMTHLLADIVNLAPNQQYTKEFFVRRLTPLAKTISWTSKNGPFAGVGGQSGAMDVYTTLKKALPQ